MKYLNKSIKSILACLIIMALGSLLSCGGDDGSTATDSLSTTAQDLAIAKQGSGSGSGPGPGPGGATDTQVFDTSFALEFSYSCLGGGCHEIDQKLVDDYAASKMTHTMVKCNACHGTHTADTVGLDKPNLTGYYPGIGATGYKVNADRCKVCHNNEHSGGGKKSGDDCYSCHAPHVFATPNGK